MALRLDKSSLIYFFIPLLTDQLSKLLFVFGYFKDKEVTSFLDLSLVYNRGVSFGLFGYGSLMQFSIVTALIFGIIIYFAWFMRLIILVNWMRIGTLFVLSGAISNLLDRLIHHGVVDFISFHYVGYFFPIFNVADVFISLGVAIILFRTIFYDEKW